MAALNNFGAVFTFAIDLETRLRDYFTAAGDSARATESDKRRATLERVRRENVTEIKLEPITDLDSDDYAIDTSDVSAAGVAKASQVAAQYYAAAAPKINVREAQRALERAGRGHGG